MLHANKADLVYQSFVLLFSIIHYCTPTREAHNHAHIDYKRNSLKMRYDFNESQMRGGHLKNDKPKVYYN